MTRLEMAAFAIPSVGMLGAKAGPVCDGPYVATLPIRGRDPSSACPGRGIIPVGALASGQTVRHLTLDQGIEGSNPSSPANAQDTGLDLRTDHDLVV